MPPRSNRGKGGHSTRSQGGVRNSTSPRSNNTARTKDIERMADIIRPHVVTAITTVIEQVYNISQDNTIHENEIRKVRERGMHVVNEKKKEKARKEKNQNPRRKPRKYQGTHPWCAECKRHHQEQCKVKVCFKCKSPRHMIKDCGAQEERRTETNENKRKRNDGVNIDKEVEGKRKAYEGTNPYCAKCDWHHSGECRKEKVCHKCKKPGHFVKNCPDKTAKCTECGDYCHLRNMCPRFGKDKNESAQSRVFQLDNANVKE